MRLIFWTGAETCAPYGTSPLLFYCSGEPVSKCDAAACRIPELSFPGSPTWLFTPETKFWSYSQFPRRRSSGRLRALKNLKTLHTPSKRKHQDDQKNQSQTTTRVITPTAAVGPSGQCSHHQKDEQNQKNCSHTFSPRGRQSKHEPARLFQLAD